MKDYTKPENRRIKKAIKEIKAYRDEQLGKMWLDMERRGLDKGSSAIPYRLEHHIRLYADQAIERLITA